ncbi:MAG TPA: hypothetical protein VJN64_04940 [Terriglobales bacterium]|nr:hypothetical protein [Terriglobales bacterium]
MPENSGKAASSDSALREAITDAIRRSPLKRSVICERLTELTGVRVTEHMLSDFTSVANSKKPARFPLLFAEPLAVILDDDSVSLLALRPRARQLFTLGLLMLEGSRQQRECEVLRESLMTVADSKDGPR